MTRHGSKRSSRKQNRNNSGTRLGLEVRRNHGSGLMMPQDAAALAVVPHATATGPVTGELYSTQLSLSSISDNGISRILSRGSPDFSCATEKPENKSSGQRIRADQKRNIRQCPLCGENGGPMTTSHEVARHFSGSEHHIQVQEILLGSREDGGIRENFDDDSNSGDGFFIAGGHADQYWDFVAWVVASGIQVEFVKTHGEVGVWSLGVYDYVWWNRIREVRDNLLPEPAINSGISLDC
ncbi:hypothetical protein V1511DRAFT_43862 [Dipodascopsis uninucleata]